MVLLYAKLTLFHFTREKFWEHLSRYLMDNLPEECEEVVDNRQDFFTKFLFDWQELETRNGHSSSWLAQ